MGIVIRSLILTLLLSSCQDWAPAIQYSPPPEDFIRSQAPKAVPVIHRPTIERLTIAGWEVTITQRTFYDGGVRLTHLALSWPLPDIPKQLQTWLIKWSRFGENGHDIVDVIKLCGLTHNRSIYRNHLVLVLSGSQSALQKCLPKVLELIKAPTVAADTYARVKREIQVQRRLNSEIDGTALDKAIEQTLLQMSQSLNGTQYSEDNRQGVVHLLTSTWQQRPRIDLIANDVSDWKSWLTRQLPQESSLYRSPETTTHKPSLASVTPGIYLLPRSGAQQAKVRIVRAIKNVAKDEQHKAALKIARVILGNSLNGWLGKDLRERLGLTYTIDTSTRSLEDHSLLIVTSQASYPKARALIQGAQYHLQRLFEQHQVTKQDFEYAKAVILWTQAMQQPSPFNELRTRLDEHIDGYSWLTITNLTYTQFMDWLNASTTNANYIFASGDKSALKHYLCEYFTNCSFIN